jgi:hypothetical protein
MLGMEIRDSVLSGHLDVINRSLTDKEKREQGFWTDDDLREYLRRINGNSIARSAVEEEDSKGC